LRERQGNTTNRTSPTAAMLSGDFNGITNVIYDPLTTAPNPSGSGTIRTPFSGNRINANRLSPQAAFFNKYLTTAPAPGGLYTFSRSTVVDTDQITARLDQTFSSRHRAFFRYNLADNRLSEPGSTPDLGSA